ncbi:MAG: hypothetical protein U5K54_26025 [Cytophagales bacterium]|nr:hypothetical protein [Cytophagales bacterium]
MKKIYIIIAILISGITSCEDQLDVQNPINQLLKVLKPKRVIVNFAQGGVYVNGFYSLKFVDGVPGRFFTGAVGYHELMGDVIGVEAANTFMNQIGLPDMVTHDNGTLVPNPASPSKQKDLVRQINTNANQGQNTLFYEWAYMYGMNNACNVMLSLIEDVQFLNRR